jgi:hypothetical protein
MFYVSWRAALPWMCIICLLFMMASTLDVTVQRQRLVAVQHDFQHMLHTTVHAQHTTMASYLTTNYSMVFYRAGKQESWEGLQPAAASELSALLAKISAIASSVGMSGEDSRGGGAQGSHGRRRLPLGHIRAILSRAQANTWVSMQGVGVVAVQAPRHAGQVTYGSCIMLAASCYIR